MGERTIERDDEPIMDEQGEALRHAIERAERAEAELAKLKTSGHHTSHSGVEIAPNKHTATHASEGHTHTSHTSHSDHGSRDTHGHSEGKVHTHESSGHGHEARHTHNTHEAHDLHGKHGHLVEPGSMDREKQPAAQSPEGHAVGEPQSTGLEALREDTMMAHLLDALEDGQDIGHYGRLTFAMIARHFLNDDEVLAELTKDEDFSEDEARQMLVQVEGRDYSPPRRDRIMQWQAEQEFRIIPDTDDPDCGNVYKSLRFPKETYNHIGHYQQEKSHY